VFSVEIFLEDGLARTFLESLHIDNWILPPYPLKQSTFSSQVPVLVPYRSQSSRVMMRVEGILFLVWEMLRMCI
jgi:hypothetical protein